MIGSICSHDVDFAEPGESVQVAAKRMETRKVGSLVVVDAGREPIGILTDRDVALRVAGAGRDPARTTVEEVMTAEPTRVSSEDTLVWALEVMRVEGRRRLVVMDRDDTLVGVLSLDDVLDHLSELFAAVRDLVEESSPRAVLHGV